MDWSTCIDWLAFTMPVNAGELIPSAWGEQYAPMRGLYGYDEGVRFESGVMLFRHTQIEDMGVFVQYSGDALRHISPITPLMVLTSHMANGHTPKRIDVALDVFDASLTAGEIETLYNAGKVLTRAKQGTLIRQDSQRRGEGYYIGSMKKRKKLLRCYDKGAETKSGKDWFRFELQCSNTSAFDAMETFYTRGDSPDFIIGMIKGFADIPIERLSDLFDVPALKVKHTYEPSPDAALDAAFKTIPVWVARLMHRYSTSVLDALLEQVAAEFCKLDNTWEMEISLRTVKKNPAEETG